MLKRLIKAAKKDDLKLAPFIGIGCPGHDRGRRLDRSRRAKPARGNWTSSRFNLPVALHKAIPKIGDDETAILLHNDAVVQGLSEIPFMQDVERWGAITIGTGLGNARFTNRHPD